MQAAEQHRTRTETDDQRAPLFAELHVALGGEEFDRLVGGAAFGMSPYLRLSFAAEDAVLAEAADRLERFVGGLTG